MATKEQIEATRKIIQLSDEWLAAIIDIAESVRPRERSMTNEQLSVLHNKVCDFMFGDKEVGVGEQKWQRERAMALINLILDESSK